MKVLKFGGSSVGTPDRIKKLIDILKKYQERGHSFTVVFSAFSGVTDSLIEMATLASKGESSYIKIYDAFVKRHNEAIDELLSGDSRVEAKIAVQDNFKDLENLLKGIFLLQEASLRTMDYVLSFGERNSSGIIAAAMNQLGIQAEYLDARKIIITDKHFGSAKVDFAITNAKIAQYYAEHQDKTQVVTGFIGSDKGGLTTTLGRGGSDYTAAIIGAALDAEAIEIWTDVDGVLTADPRKVKKAFTVPVMSYGEAMEMSHFGAKVIYPPTIQPALAKKIPLYIKNTFNPDFIGTLVSEGGDPSGRIITGISSISNIALLTLQGGGLFGVPGIAARLFNALGKGGINIILITQGSSEYSISFAVNPSDAKKAVKIVAHEFEYEMRDSMVEPVKQEMDLSIIAIIGENMRFRPGIAGMMFQALGKNGINIHAIAQGSSELNISVVVPKVDETKSLNALHEAFFLSDTKQLNLFITGAGLIGGTLLKQIERQASFLKNERLLDVKVVGLSNSKKMIFNEDGIELSAWRELLHDAKEKADIAHFVKKMNEMNLSNTIFVDNTSSEKVASYYEQILDESISISTPNKIANSSSYEQYLNLQKIAAKRNVQFKYETNVGAGLPVISTLRDLTNSGDQIIKIEGILSGTLAYIFNNFKEGVLFSEIVSKAKQLGLTEPDPRDDLSGRDVRRKIMILGREVGHAIESDDVIMENILPESCINAATVDDFFVELQKHDAYFEGLRSKAAAAGKVLRMAATFENGEAKIGLIAVDSNHPFYLLSGSDNMIVFTTERYKERPLVVRGPGAGAEVTAAGIFAEIISIGNFL
ncbi:MAG: bifunctional aspartate kinase/homoserine dehydrogenase I [Saprospiraceae bacterium]